MNESEYGKKQRHKAVPAVYLFLTDLQTGRVLLALRQNTGYQDGMWNVPSGHIEGDELPREALVRESKEEVGIDFDPCDAEHVHTSYRPAHDPTGARVDLFFRISTWSGEVRNAEPEKCERLEWFPLRGPFPPNTSPHVLHALNEWWKKEEPFSELGVEWLKKHGLYKL